MVEHQTPKSGFWNHIPTPRDPWVSRGGGVVFSNDLGQLRVGSVSVLLESLGIVGIPWDPLESIGILWNPLEPVGIDYNSVKSFGIP